MAKNTTDTRIVQMQFDNKQFERGIKTSEKSLEKFKQYLDFSKCEKSLDDLSKATSKLTFDNAIDNLQKLTDKFTGLGTVSELVLSQIRRGIEDTARKISGFIDSLSFQQISVGLGKFEYLNKNIQTIMAATGKSEEEVTKVMKRLNEYTDQTSYSFTDMASNIGKFTSVGIPLEKAEKQMEGIANWAARSGAGIQEASRAMYNLSQAMGAGKLLKIDWRSIENADMATKEFKEQMIQAGIAAGTLEMDKSGVIKTAKSLGKQMDVTYQNLSETLSKGWANTNVIGNTLERYYQDDLYPWLSEEPGKAVLELSETQKTAFDKMIKADGKLNRANYKTLENMGVWTAENKKKIIELAAAHGKLTETTDKEGKKQYEAVDKNGKKIQVTVENLEETLTSGWFDKGLYETATSINTLAKEAYEAAQKCKSFTDVIQAWKDQLSTGWMNFFQHIFGGLSESMEIFSNICNKVGESFSNFVRTLSGGYEILENGQKVWREGIMGTWANQGGRESLWSMFIGEYDGMYEGAYGLLDVIHDIGKMISDGFWLMIKSLDPNAANVSNEDWLANETYRTQELGFALKSATDKVRNFVQGIKDFFTEVPEGASKSRFQMVQDVVNGAWNTATIVYTAIRDIINFINVLLDQNHLGPAIDHIIEIFSMLGKEMTKAGQEANAGHGLKYFLDKLLGVLGNKDEGLIHSFNELLGFIKELIGWLIGANNEESRTIQLWKILADFFLRKVKKVALVLNHVIFPIIGFFRELLEAGKDLAKGEIDFTGFVERVKTGIKNAINAIFNFTPDFTGKVKQIFEDIKNVFKSGFSQESIDQLSSHIGVMWEDLKKKIPQSVKTALKSIYNGISGFISNAIAKIKEFFKPFFDDVKAVFTSGFSKASLKKLKARFTTIFQTISNMIPQGLKDGFNNVLAKIEKSVSDVWTKIKEKIFGSFSEDKDKSGEGPLDTIKRYIRAYTNPKEFGMGGDTKKSIFTIIIDWLKAGFEKVKEYVSKVFGNIASLGPVKKIKAFAEQILHPGGFEQKESIFDRISSLIHNGLQKIQKTFSSEEDTVWSRIKAFFSKIDLSSLALLIIGALGTIGLIKVITKASKAVNSILLIAENISKIPKSIGDIVNGPTIKEQLGDKMLKFAVAIGIVAYALYKIGSMDFGKAMQGFIVIGLIVGGMVVSMNLLKNSLGTMSAKEYKRFTAALAGMIEIAIAIWIVSRAMDRIGKLDWAQWGRAILGFAAVIGGFWLVSEMLKKGGTFKKNQLAGLMVLAGSVVLLSLSIAVLSHIDFWKLVKAIVAVGAMMLLLVGIASFINSETKGVGLANSGVKELGFLAMGVALLALAVVPLALLPIKRLVQGVVAVGALVLILFGLVYLINKENKENMTMKNSAMAQLIAVAGAIVLLVTAVIVLALLPAAKMWQAVLAVLAIITAFGIFIVAVNQFTYNGAGLKGTAMAQLIAVAGAIMMLVLAMIPLALLPKKQFEQSMKGVIWLVTALAAFVVIVNQFSGGNKLSGMVGLLAVAGAIMMLVLAMIPLALLKPEQLTQALVGVITLMATMALLVGLIDKFGSNVKPGALVALLGVAAAVLLLVMAIVPLTLMDPLKLTIAIAGIAALMAAMALVLYMMSKMQSDAKMAAKNAILLVALAGTIYVFAIAIEKVKNVKWEVIAAFAGGLSVMLVAMAAAIKIMSTIHDPAAMISGMLVLIGGIALLMGAIALLGPIMIDALGGAIEQLMARLDLISGMFSTFASDMDTVSESSLDAAKRKFDKLLEIVRSMAGVGSYYSDIQSFADCMLMLGSGLSQFVFSTQGITDVDNLGGIKMIEKFLALKEQLADFTIGKTATEVFSLGGGLSLFASATTSITDGNPPALQLLQNLANQADNLTTLSKLPLYTLKSRIAGLGGALSIYAEGADELNTIEGGNLPDVDKAVELMHKVTESFSGENGKFEIPDIPKESDLAGFGADIAALATAIKKFANASAGMTSTNKATELLGFLATLKTNLTKDNLVFATAFKDAGITDGGEVLSNFAIQIALLGYALSAYDDQVKNFTGNENATKALEFFRNLKEKLTKDDLDAVRVFDELGQGDEVVNVLTRFGTDIGALGEALSKFAEKTNFDSGMKTNFDNAIMALDYIVDIARRLPKIGGLKGFWEGNTETLGTLADDLDLLGQGLSKMSNALTGSDSITKFDSTLVNEAIGALNSIAILADSISQIGKTPYDGYGDITDLAVFISRFTNIKDWPGDENLEHSKTIIDYFVDMMASLRDASKTAGGFDDVKPFEAFHHMAQGISDLLKVDPDLDFEDVGVNITGAMEIGILRGQEELNQTIVDVVRAAVRIAKATAKEKSPSSLFMEIGQYMSLGLALGINQKATDASDSAKSMVEETIKASQETAKVRSPSRVFTQLGEYFSLGLALGIENANSNPVNSASELIDTIRNRAQTALANLSYQLSQSIDPNPTITPVLDLSNIQNGMSTMNGLFSNPYGLSLSGGTLMLDPSSSAFYANQVAPKDYSADFENVRGEVANMRGDLKELSESMRQMKFVFHSGQVVAAIGPEMDQYLATQGYFSVRGEIP